MKSFLRSPKILALVLLLGVGLAKLPFEQRLADELQAQQLVEPPPDVGLLDNVGQMGAAASLGGLRSLVAGITYLEAYGAFEDVDWGQVDLLMTLTTRLEPHDTTYWEEASWHMAYNAAAYYERDKSLQPLMRDQLMREHEQRGVEILETALRFLPNEPRLYLKLGLIYKDRLVDHRNAAAAFEACYDHGGPDYAERMAAYELTLVNDHACDLKAYEILKRYYDMGMKKRNTTIMVDLPILEERLGIPKDQRAVAKDDDEMYRAFIKVPRHETQTAPKK